ncbi:MAG: DUF92 domain-containing protein [Acidobacteriota bacterium]|nr:DUF92 domain-containing protein [Acidobacteriota bacterium]
MPEFTSSIVAPRAPLLSTRKIVHMSMLIFAFLLPYLTWAQAAGCALLALLFNFVVLPRIGADMRKSPAGSLESKVLNLEAASARGIRDNVWMGIIIYPISVLLLILLYGDREHLQIVAAVWAIMALGDGTAGVAGCALRGPSLPWNRDKTWSGFAGFILAGTAGAYLLTRWVAPGVEPDVALRICAATALVGAIVESAPIRLDDNATVPLVSGAFMFCLYFVERSALDSNLPFLGRRLVLAAAVNLLLAALALGLKMVNRSGAVCGFLLGVAVYLGYGYKSFLMMFTFFAIGSIATRIGYARKAARGVAEKRGGARSWREAAANSLVGAFFSILVITTHHEGAFLLALIAAFAEAAGDTVSSEIGQWISGHAYMITTFKVVPAGEDGGVSVGGSIAGGMASTLIVALAFAMGLCGKGCAVIALSAAIAGNLLDSLLGATLEQRGLVTNGIVNFAGTSFAGALALCIALRIGF